MTEVPDPSILSAGSPIEAREERLVEGADELADARRSLLGHPRLLIGSAAALMSAGICAILLAWIGASHSTFVEEQVPYLISGGLLGVALSTIGALLFFTHWLTVSIKEARRHEAARRQDHEELLAARRQDHEELLAAVRALGAALTEGKSDDADARGDQPQRPLRRTPRRT